VPPSPLFEQAVSEGFLSSGMSSTGRFARSTDEATKKGKQAPRIIRLGLEWQ
jgi:hypothetical protein